MKAEKLSLKPFEIVWYALCALVALWGLTYIVLGLISAYANVTPSENVLLKGNNALQATFGLGFLGWGLIILAIAVVAFVFVLCIYAKNLDRVSEKAQRRAARLGQTAPQEDKAVVAE